MMKGIWVKKVWESSGRMRKVSWELVHQEYEGDDQE